MASRVPGKRAFDLVASAIALILLGPVLAIAGVAVRLTSRGPALYRATRVGRDGQLFTMYKFRSMYRPEDWPPDLPPSDTTGLNDPRVTPFGRMLRNTKVDELPQLINVLRGEMSLVGPRPEVVDCVALYTDEERDILSVRPGITDLASLEFSDLATVVGQSDNPHEVYLSTVFKKKNLLRLQYAREASWRLDMRILFRTFAAVIGRSAHADT